MFKRLCILSLTTLSLIGAYARSNKNVLSQTITDNAVVFPESYEVDARKMLEGWYMKNYTATDNSYNTREDVKVSDEEIQRRLAALPCIIEMPYNQIVRQYIERYTKKGRPQVAAMLGLGIYYYPIFEQALEEEGLPLELKYLPVIESALDPNAVSRHGATGLWQFMLGAAKGLGMEVNSLVDERRDPYTSSRTAAKFLKDLYSTYGDWSLAIAAYNCGPGAVNKAIRRAGGDPKQKDFWSIYYYLPTETRGYVPMFIAANYVMNYYRDHNISPVLPTKPLVTDTVGVTHRVHFDQISSVLDIPKDEIRVLNPQFRADIIPGSDEKPYYLILPSQQIHAYILSEPQILNYNADLYARQTTATPGGEPNEDITVEEPFNPNDLLPAQETALAVEAEAAESAAAAVAEATPAGARRTVNHTVAAGQTLNDIASIYGVSASDIRRANSLRRNAVRPGQQLRIETTYSDAQLAARAGTPASQPSRTQPASNSYTQPAVASTTQQSTIADNTATPAPSRSYSSKKDNKAADKTAVSKKSKKKPYVTPKPKVVKHEVKSGDSYERIAKKYGVSVDELKKANNSKSDIIHPGDNIKIPSKAKASSKSKKSSKSKSSKSRKSKKRR